MLHRPAIDPERDLVLERLVDLPPDLVWRAWTEPELLMRWFTPAPWTTFVCEIDLRAGGRFSTVMRSPEGEHFSNEGCYLEVVPYRKLVWTDALEPDFRPTRREPGPDCPFLFTGTILFEPHGQGTKYTAIAMHRDRASREQHEAMGFQDGWGAALAQLVDVVREMQAG